MDLPVKERYVELAEYGKPHLHALCAYIDSKVPVPEFIYNAIGWLAKRLDPVKEPEFLERMEVMAELTGISFGRVYVVNYLYEIVWCTSLVLQNKDGVIMHGRNLDFFMTE